MVIRFSWLALLALASCVQEDIDQPRALAELNRDAFRCEVQPVLAARCSFMACHGNDERPFKIFAEQRLRLDIDWIDYETPLGARELEANFQLVRGFVEPVNLLALKPLDTKAGGHFHGGKDLYGDEDVFVSADDPGYRKLVSFALGKSAEPGCVATEEVGP